jgi:hypothetical protein
MTEAVARVVLTGLGATGDAGRADEFGAVGPRLLA